MCFNTPEFVDALLGAWRLSATVVPVNHKLQAPELEYILTSSGAFPIELSPSRFSIRSSMRPHSSARGEAFCLAGYPAALATIRANSIYVLIKTFGTRNINRAEAAAYGRLLLGPDSGRAFLQIMRSVNRTPAFEQGIKAALKTRSQPRSFGARMIQL
jgi:hypothetical protein